MQSKIVRRRRLLLLFSAVIIFLIIFLLYSIQQRISRPADKLAYNNSMVLGEHITTINNQDSASFGMPVRIKIPKIGVDVDLESVGLTSEGAVDTAKNQENAAWFNLGPRPGENGSAVITGHYGWTNKKASVFDDLYKLRAGDKIYIVDDKGMILSFVMRKNRRYDPDANAVEVFHVDDGKSHLNLITCEGVWNKIVKSYSKRLVVFADKE